MAGFYKVKNDMLKNGVFNFSNHWNIDLVMRFMQLKPDPSIDFRGCSQLRRLKGSTSFHIYAGYTDLESIENATFNGRVDIAGCKRLTSIKGTKFNKHTNLSLCTGLTSIKGTKFEETAPLFHCKELTSIEGTKFNGNADISDCTQLTSIKGAMFNRNANLKGCTGLTSIEGSKFNGDINLQGCTNLVQSPNLITQLEEHERNGHAVVWPEHFSRGGLIDSAKGKLQNIVNNYKEQNPAGAPKTLELFNRFLTEGLGQRGGKSAVVNSVSPFLESLEKKPEHLKWVEEISSNYLDGCVNQPVAGFGEITAFMAIAEAPDIKSKIEASRQVVYLDVIKDSVLSKFNNRAVEAEAGNAMLREVHSKLLSDKKIKKEWPGVPGSVAYEGMVKEFVCDENVAKVSQAVIKSMNKEHKEVADYLLNRYGSVFCNAAFPDEVKALETQYKDKKDALTVLMTPGYKKEDLDDQSQGFKEEAKHYLLQLARGSESNRTDQLQEIYNNLSVNMQQDLIDTVRQKMDSEGLYNKNDRNYLNRRGIIKAAA